MIVLGYILLIVGCIIAVVGELKFLVVAYRSSLWWFFGCLFVPLVSLVFFLLNLKATLRPVGLQVFGLLLAGFGVCVAGVIWPAQTPYPR